MDRFRFVRARFCVSVLGAALAICMPLAGCNWLSVALYAINPNDIPANFKGLAEKRVVVVCRPVVELQFSDSVVPSELTHLVSQRLKQRVKKIDLVDEDEVAEWVDENTWHNFAEVGKAMKADMVIGIDLEQFQLHQGPTLFQGEAALNVVVIDVKDGGKQIFNQPLSRVRYPPHTPIPASEKSEPEFRRQFISVLAEQIGRNFYAHESRVDFASDAGL
jgi:hypothetical protein